MAHPRRGMTVGVRVAVVAAAIALAYVGRHASIDGSHAGVAGLGSTARAEVDWGVDSDGDGLPDECEVLFDLSPTVADSDGDGCDDGAEWVLRADPRDPASMPDPQPALRSYAYEAEGRIRVFCAVYPANLDFVESFRLLLGSPSFKQAPEGDPGTGIGLYDVSTLLAGVAGSFTESTYLGLSLLGFDFEIDRALLDTHGPLSLGWAARLAGVPVIDQLYLGVQGTTAYVLAPAATPPSSAASLAIQPLAPIPPAGDDKPEYCEVGLSDGSSAGVASVEYTVTSADCAPDGLLYCIDADCTALSGQTFVLVDYGFLQSKAQ